MAHLALNVYFWGDSEVDRLLADCLGAAARELGDDGLLHRFWFTVFDARGPHVIAVLTALDDAVAHVQQRLGARLDRYLAEHPSTVALTAEELERRHSGCRGKQLSAIDAEPGFAPNNSYRIVAHPADGYPFNRSTGVATQDELWEIVQEVVFWAIDQRRARTATAAAVRWIGWIDRMLARAGADPAEFWRHHATTLLVHLDERLHEDEAAVLAAIAAVGERNRAVFERLWDDGPRPSACERLVEIVLADDGRTAEQKRRLLRDINHCTLAQLGQPVARHIPLVLYAWQRNLELQGA